MTSTTILAIIFLLVLIAVLFMVGAAVDEIEGKKKGDKK